MIQKYKARIWLQWVAIVVPVLVAPILLFPRREWMVLGLAVPAVWVGNYWLKKRFFASTPLNLLLFPLLVMVWVSLYATFDVEFSLGKVAGTLLGVFIFFGLVQFIDRESYLWLGLSGLCFGGVVFGLVSLVVTKWRAKIDYFPNLNQMFPVRFTGLPGLPEGFNLNPVGGTLVLFIPLLLLLAIYFLRASFPARRATATTSAGNLPARRIATALLGASAVVSVFLLGAILLLSQSRSAWAGFVLASSLMSFVHFRWFRWGALAVIPVTVMLWFFRAWGEVFNEISGAGLGWRLELWPRAIYWIQDFPFAGIGMNSFRKFIDVWYGWDIASAHNHLLQAALDLGIPGMVVYVVLWTAVARLLWILGSRSEDPLKRLVAMGLGTGLLAQFFYQTTDAIPLGAKVGIFWWISLGLVVSMFSLVEREGVIERRPRVPEWMALLMWPLFSLASIYFIGESPYLGLGIGIAGGVALGYYAVESYLSKGTQAEASSQKKVRITRVESDLERSF